MPIKKIATESTRIENLVQKSSQKVLNPILPNTWVRGSTKGFYMQTNHGTQIEWHTPAVATVAKSKHSIHKFTREQSHETPVHSKRHAREETHHIYAGVPLLLPDST